ncbi:MAG: glycosyltransferase [Planctomycetes bacterium]|nr:glycosyltransferase [Planctomycetota bacterium]
MHIVYVTGLNLEKMAGGAVHATSLARELAKLDHQVTLIVDRSGGIELEGCEVASVGVPTFGPVKTLRYHKKIAKFLGESLGKSKPEDTILYLRGPWAYVPAAAKRLKFPVVCEANGVLIDELEAAGANMVQRAVFERVEGKGYAEVDHTVCVCEGIRKRLAQRYSQKYGLAESRLSVTGNGSDADRAKVPPSAEFRSSLGIPESAKIVGFIGDLFVWTNLEPFIDAVCESGDADWVRLVVIGGGPRENELRGYAKRKPHPERAIFTGSFPHSKMAGAIANFDVSVIARQGGIFAQPLKLFEYLAAGTPVIAPRREDFEFLERDRLGVLVDKLDKADVARSIGSILRGETSLLSRDEIKSLFLRDHTWEVIAKKTAAVFETVRREKFFA